MISGLKTFSSKFPEAPPHVHRHVVAGDLGAHHGEGLGLRRVDLARNDGTAGLVLRDGNLADPAAGPGGQPPDVVGNLHEGRRQSLERPVNRHQGIVGRQGLELVLRRDERVPGQLGDLLGRALRELGVGVEPRPHRGPPDGQLVEVRQGRLRVPERVIELAHPPRDLLSERQRHRVLEVRPPDLDDVGEGPRLLVQRVAEPAHGREEPPPDLLYRGDVHGGGGAIV